MSPLGQRRHTSATGRAVSDVLEALSLPDTPTTRDALTALYERGYNAASSAKSQRQRRGVATTTSDVTNVRSAMLQREGVDG